MTTGQRYEGEGRGTQNEGARVAYVPPTAAVPQGKRWNKTLGKLEDAIETTPRPHEREALEIVHGVGLPIAAVVFIERMLTLEARLAHFESIFPAHMRASLETLAGRESAMLASPQGR
ncbi:MAG TPA: hypothetical protein VHZ30_01070 [Verrucomicrobiae bacterium]|nr:hypothetical protein [Verrucomicrobiae bacterium]